MATKKELESAFVMAKLGSKSLFIVLSKKGYDGRPFRVLRFPETNSVIVDNRFNPGIRRVRINNILKYYIE